MENRIIANYKKNKPSVGTLSHLKSSVAIEALGAVGMDYVMLDLEHSPLSVSEAASYLTAATAAHLTPLVRVNELSRSAVLSMLDAGAMGVIVPCVESVDQVKDLIRFAKFVPVGERGYCMTRDGQWGFADSYAEGLEGYMKYANAQTLLIPQCETMGCLENIEEITALDGVDGILIGPYDLSIAMGMPGQFENEEFKAALRRILDACKKNHKLAMIFNGNPADAKKSIEDGYDVVLLGLDVLVLINGYRALMNGLK